MSHDLVLAQSHAFQLSRDLMVPVTVFEVDGKYGVLCRLAFNCKNAAVPTAHGT